MKASELRIGNYVNWISYTIKLDGVCQHYFTTDAPLEVINPKQVDPILLTEEWLKKFEFRYTDEDTWRDQWIKGPIALYGNPMKGGWTVESIEPHFEVHHVHQLQNLYFALTGEELVIKQG